MWCLSRCTSAARGEERRRSREREYLYDFVGGITAGSIACRTCYEQLGHNQPSTCGERCICDGLSPGSSPMKLIPAAAILLASIIPTSAQKYLPGLSGTQRVPPAVFPPAEFVTSAQKYPPGTQRVFPPAEFDHAYTDGPTIMITMSDVNAFKVICTHSLFNGIKYPAVGCAYMLKKACLVIMASKDAALRMGLNVHKDDTGVRHEIAHCNGWAGDHLGGRTREQAGRAPYNVMAKTDCDVAQKAYIEWLDTVKTNVEAFQRWKDKVDAHTESFAAWVIKAQAYKGDEAYAIRVRTRLLEFDEWEAKSKAAIETFTTRQIKIRAVGKALCREFKQATAEIIKACNYWNDDHASR
jgi:hypothetical protein